MNVVLQAMTHVRPLRDYLLLESNLVREGESTSVLVERLGEFVRKIWNPRAFKCHVSPHEVVQACRFIDH